MSKEVLSYKKFTNDCLKCPCYHPLWSGVINRLPSWAHPEGVCVVGQEPKILVSGRSHTAHAVCSIPTPKREAKFGEKAEVGI